MKKNYLCFLLIIFVFLSNKVYSSIEERIIAKIGNNIITKYDLINEINTILAISNTPANSENVDNLKDIAFASLKQKLIKKNEIEKYKVRKYNNVDLNNYLSSLENNIGLKDIDLEDHFKKYNANYLEFINGVIINLKWNTLIYSLYNKQLDVDEELIKTKITDQIKKEKKIIEYNLSEIVIENLDKSKTDKIFKSIKDIGFDKTATLFSNSQSSAKGGLIGWIASNSISTSYLSEIKNLEINQISKPIKNNNNIVIIKLNDKRIVSQNNIDLDRIEKNVVNQRKQEKLNIFSNSHLLDLEKKIYVEINE